MINSLFTASIGLLVVASVLHSQTTDCLATCEKMVLVQGIFRTKATVQSSDREKVEKSLLCSADYGVVRQLTNTYFTTGISLPPFAASLGTEFNEQKLSAWRKEHCESQFQFGSSKDLFTLVESIADPVLVEGVNRCVRTCTESKAGLFCELSELDDQNLTFFFKWTPTSNADLKSPPKISSISFGGATALGDNSQIQSGQPVSVSGTFVPLRRLSAGSLARAVIRTTSENPMSCEASREPAGSEFTIKISHNPQGEISKPISQSFSFDHNTNGDCGMNVGAVDNACLPDGEVLTHKFHDRTKNCGSGVTEFKPRSPTSNCIQILGRLSGCGWEYYGKDPFGGGGYISRSCKGNGWYGFDLEVIGQKWEQGSLPPLETSKVISLAQGKSGSVSFSYPPESSKNTRSITWNYTIEVLEKRAGRNVSTYTVTREKPVFDKVESSVDSSGSVTVTIRN